jgi:hypothetical protein
LQKYVKELRDQRWYRSREVARAIVLGEESKGANKTELIATVVEMVGDLHGCYKELVEDEAFRNAILREELVKLREKRERVQRESTPEEARPS